MNTRISIYAMGLYPATFAHPTLPKYALESGRGLSLMKSRCSRNPCTGGTLTKDHIGCIPLCPSWEELFPPLCIGIMSCPNHLLVHSGKLLLSPPPPK